MEPTAEMVLLTVLVLTATVCVFAMAVIQTYLSGYKRKPHEPELKPYYPYHDTLCSCGICRAMQEIDQGVAHV